VLSPWCFPEGTASSTGPTPHITFPSHLTSVSIHIILFIIANMSRHVNDKNPAEEAKPLLPVPYHPLIILTPAPSHSPSFLAMQLLTSQCQALIADPKLYTITASPVNYAPSKNDFFSLAPAWWQKADGSWGTSCSIKQRVKLILIEHRDGMRNPSKRVSINRMLYEADVIHSRRCRHMSERT
jgi:hypothetical protein